MRTTRQQMADEAADQTMDDFTVRHYDTTDDGAERYEVRDSYGTEGYFTVSGDAFDESVEAGRVTRPSRNPVWLRKARSAVTNEHRQRSKEAQGYAYHVTIDGTEFVDYHDCQIDPLYFEDDAVDVTVISWDD